MWGLLLLMAQPDYDARAYSILSVKALSDARREFSGTATTPTPDSVGDIVDPLGVTFQNPLKLLLFHDHERPVGHVTFHPPTPAGIDFTATIPVIEEPGALKSRVDEAWHSVKARLLTAVSVRVRARKDDVTLLKGGGIHFRKSQIQELSLVTFGANPEATIAVVKQLDTERRAALGLDADRVPSKSTPSGASDTHPVVHLTTSKDARPMKRQEQIVAFKAEKDAKIAKLNEMASATEGQTFDAPQQQAFDTLTDEVKSLDAQLARLETLEQLTKNAAAPVNGKSEEEGSGSRSGNRIIRVTDNMEPGIEFTRYVMCLSAAKGQLPQALAYAQARYPDLTRVHETLKAAVAAGTTTDPTWAAPLVSYQNFAGDFIEYSRPATIIGKFGTDGIPPLHNVPPNIRVIGQSSGGDAAWVGEGLPKPLTKFDFTAITLGWAKVAAISVLTQELVRHSTPSAERLVRDSLRAAITARLDTDFIDPSKAAVPNVSPASITNGIAAIPPSGTDADAARHDIQSLLAPFIAANVDLTSAVFIMSPTTAVALSLMRSPVGVPDFPNITVRGGNLLGYPVIVSQYAASVGSPAASMLILATANNIYLADEGQVVIDASTEASLEMSTTPNGNVIAPAPTTSVSMFQTNSIALRAERWINWQRRIPEAVQYIAPVAYMA